MGFLTRALRLTNAGLYESKVKDGDKAMKYCRGLSRLLLVVLFLTGLNACVGKQDKARQQLTELGIPYSQETMVERSAEGDLVAVRLFLTTGMSPNIAVDGITPLIAASMQGNVEVVETLLSNGADPNMEGLKNGTALVMAAHDEHVAIAKLLLEAGAEVNVVMEETGTPLMLASSSGNTELVRLLLDAGADPNLSLGSGMGAITALVMAAGEGHIETVNLLLGSGAELRQDILSSPLSMAASGGHLEVVKRLMGTEERSVASMAFMNAVMENQQEIIMYFLEEGVNTNLALKYAEQNNLTGIVQLIKSYE